MIKKAKNGLSFLFGQIFTKPTESANAHGVIVKSVWLFRIFNFLFGLYQIFFGELLIGILIVVSVLFLVAPFVFTRGRISDIPLEIEFFLFIMILFQFVLGETQEFYYNIPHYDNIIHFFFPFLISIIGFTVAYTLYFSGKLKVSIGTMIFFVVVITLGVGAFWEIIEYSNDIFLVPRIAHWNRFQGPSDKAIYDTMNDLVADLLGGIFGAIIASRYIIEAKYNKRLRELIKEIGQQIIGKTKPKKR